MKNAIPKDPILIYRQMGRWFFANHRICSFLYSAASLGQNASLEIRGTVNSAVDGETLPGAIILLNGSTSGAVTGMDGSFSLVVPSQDAILVISSIGYVSQELTVGNRTNIDVTLEPDITSLSEVVVVGYGTQERAKVTGAISSVTAEDLTQLAVPNLAS